MKFNKLDQYIRQTLKENLLAKRIYMGQLSGYVNQHLANFIINKQLPIWDNNDFCNYKMIYPASKAQQFLEL